VFLFFFWVFFESLQGRIISHDEVVQKARNAHRSARTLPLSEYDILTRAQKSEKRTVILVATDDRQTNSLLQTTEALAHILSQQGETCVLIEGFMENEQAYRFTQTEKTEKTEKIAAQLTGWGELATIELKDCFLTTKDSYRILPQGTGRNTEALKHINLPTTTWKLVPIFSETDAPILHALKDDALILIGYTLGTSQHALLDDVVEMLETSKNSHVFFTEIR
jgi:hypothetical protein